MVTKPLDAVYYSARKPGPEMLQARVLDVQRFEGAARLKSTRARWSVPS